MYSPLRYPTANEVALRDAARLALCRVHGQRMLRRDLGEYSPQHMKAPPTTFLKQIGTTLTLRRPSLSALPRGRTEEPISRLS